MENIRLSDNFMLSELVKSSTADRLDIDNWPTDDQVISKLKITTQKILQPVREHFGRSFAPSSGYRCLALNRALRSKDTSQHVKGEAVDLEISGFSNYEIAAWIRDNLSFDQLILEMARRGDPTAGWVHCSYVSEEENRMEVLSLVKGEGFVNGLVE